MRGISYIPSSRESKYYNFYPCYFALGKWKWESAHVYKQVRKHGRPSDNARNAVEIRTYNAPDRSIEYLRFETLAYADKVLK